MNWYWVQSSGKKKEGEKGKGERRCSLRLGLNRLRASSAFNASTSAMAHGLRLQARRYGGTRWRVRRWYGRVEVEALAIVVLEAVAAPSEWG
ncbi:hypothetical protein E1A91_A13G189200v1 [Gossypium mustelinum]|uniref:Uncharacterized protein n=1 Tax=Gossypium mustelinum TaxID=34275 RepID=A0A5D2WJV9_GOSMU|nr:hypothetical protein E1A91_A13G189200v1 [Gossypium mustelinum]